MAQKYPNLTKSFPEDFTLTAAQQLAKGDEEFKDWFIEMSHAYAQKMIQLFWFAQERAASRTFDQFTLEKMEQFDAQNSEDALPDNA